MRLQQLIAVVACALMLTSCVFAAPDTERPQRLGAINAEINYFSSFSSDDPFAQVIAGAIGEYEAISGNRINVIWHGGESAEEVHLRHTSGVRVDIWDGDLERQLELNAEFMLDLTQFYNTPHPMFGNAAMGEIINPFLLSLGQQMSLRFAPEDAHYAGILAVPFAPFNVAFVYNQAYFAQAGIAAHPSNWQEFITLCERLRSRGIMPLSGQMRPYQAYGLYLVRTMGTRWVEELMLSPSMWTGPAVFRMAMAFDQLARNRHISRHEAFANPGPFAIVNDRVAMWLMRTSDISRLVQDSEPGTTFGAFNFPFIEGELCGLDPLVPELPEGTFAAMHGSHAFFISSNTRLAGDVFDFIATIFSPNFDQQMSLETYSIPFAADIPWPAEIRGIEQSFREIGAWLPYGGGTLSDHYTRKRADEQFMLLLRGRIPARDFINVMRQ